MKKRFTKITDLPALLTFAVFAVCILMVLLYGARVYGQLVQHGEESFRLRTATQYLYTRVQQAESVTVTEFEDCEALTIKEQVDGESYITRVYCYDGYLWELFCMEHAALHPEDGEKILPVERMGMKLEAETLTSDLDGCILLLQLRGKAGAMP